MAKNGNPVVLRCGSQLPQLQIAKKGEKRERKKEQKKKALGFTNLD